MGQPTVLVVRPDGRFSDVLRKNGCEVINLELITTEEVSDLSELDAAIHRIDLYDGIFLTSPVAAEIFLSHLKSESRSFEGKVYVLGKRIKTALEGSGLNVVSNAAANTAEELINAFDRAEFAGKDLLFIRGDLSVRTIPLLLGDIARVDELVVYKTIETAPEKSVVDGVENKLKAGGIDCACFFSPSGVDSFMTNFAGSDLDTVRAAAIGETTAGRAKEVGLDVVFVSKRANEEDFAAGFAAYIKNIE